eukprot:TRINITY_DN67_c0_g1_i1.p1 TRINITY_DN67_c0_g1~~TRINITY_DN67_c0_g1_i1.p1  ORF type:complete len:329 (+),score=71.30 TRINITY_DN67_c0_g1_i1:68-988(+)
MDAILAKQIAKMTKTEVADVDSDAYDSEGYSLTDDFSVAQGSSGKGKRRNPKKDKKEQYAGTGHRVRDLPIKGNNPLQAAAGKYIVESGWKVNEEGGVVRQKKCKHHKHHVRVSDCQHCIAEKKVVTAAVQETKEARVEAGKQHVTKKITKHVLQNYKAEFSECRWCHLQLRNGVCTGCNVIKRPNKNWRCGTCDFCVTPDGVCCNSAPVVAQWVVMLATLFPEDVIVRMVSFFFKGFAVPQTESGNKVSLLATLEAHITPKSLFYHSDTFTAARTLDWSPQSYMNSIAHILPVQSWSWARWQYPS